MRPAMGTLVEVRASAPGPLAGAAVEAALQAVARVDRLMSFHNRASDLSRLNRDAFHDVQAVDSWTWNVLRRAVRMAAASDGLFDATVAPLLVRHGVLPATGEGPDPGADWRSVTLLPGNRVRFERPLQLDLGGIAKGFAVDCAIQALRRAGCVKGVVNAGGDLRRFGEGVEPVHLRRDDALVKVAELRHGAIATSAPHGVREDRLAQPLGVVIDPRTERPWEAGGAVMVAAPTCVVADALTKVAALAGPACEPLLARFGARGYWDNEGSDE